MASLATANSEAAQFEEDFKGLKAVQNDMGQNTEDVMNDGRLTDRAISVVLDGCPVVHRAFAGKRFLLAEEDQAGSMQLLDC